MLIKNPSAPVTCTSVRRKKLSADGYAGCETGGRAAADFVLRFRLAICIYGNKLRVRWCMVSGVRFVRVGEFFKAVMVSDITSGKSYVCFSNLGGFPFPVC